jgi:hypothetical protein
MTRFKSALLAASFVLAAGAAHAENSVNVFEKDGWRVSRYADGHCVSLGAYGTAVDADERALVFYTLGNRLWVKVAKKGWTIPAGAYPVSGTFFNAAGKAINTFTATGTVDPGAENADAIYFFFPLTGQNVQPWAESASTTVKIGSQTLGYGLKGTAAAIKQTMICQSAIDANPFHDVSSGTRSNPFD